MAELAAGKVDGVADIPRHDHPAEGQLPRPLHGAGHLRLLVQVHLHHLRGVGEAGGGGGHPHPEAPTRPRAGLVGRLTAVEALETEESANKIW